MNRERGVRVLLAPDKFKGTASAVDVCRALERGLRSVQKDLEIVAVPIADGGEGTVEAAVAAGYETVPVVASGPRGGPVTTAYARRGDVAVVEMATICGLARLPGGRRAPMSSSSYGVGEVLAHAVRAGCTDLVLGVGGSASTDGGVGMMQALGARVTDARGHEVRRGGRGLADVVDLDVSQNLLARAGVSLRIAVDVTAPLSGPAGAAAVFGPQKGATPRMVAALDAGLARLARVGREAMGQDLAQTPGAGAAGGVGYGALLLGGTIVSGARLILEVSGFAGHLAHADLVITGEGSFDQQSLAGKAPIGVAAAARAAGVTTIVVAGQCKVPRDRLAEVGIAEVFSLAELAGDVRRAQRDTMVLLERVGVAIGSSWAKRVSTSS